MTRAMQKHRAAYAAARRRGSTADNAVANEGSNPSGPAKFNRVHAVCQALRDGINCKRETVCKLCPMRFKEPGYGWCVKGCVFRAQEVMNIVKYGNPWGKHGRRKHIRSWRKRWQRA